MEVDIVTDQILLEALNIDLTVIIPSDMGCFKFQDENNFF